MKNLFQRLFIVALTSLTLLSCNSLRQTVLKQELKKIPDQSPVVSKYFLGFSLYDPESKKFLLDINGDKYFTPASNTKILTLATWLAMNQDQIPSFRYTIRNNNLYIEPLGDPTFLHPDFPIQDAFSFLEDQVFDTLFIYQSTSKTSAFGSGWAWDDYNYAYQPERSVFPVYGNTLHVYTNSSIIQIVPSFFEPYVETNGEYAYRDYDFNLFQLPKVSSAQAVSNETQIPFRTSDELITKLLQDTLFRPVLYLNQTPPKELSTFYGYNRLPVLAQMMLNSDNFLAEQLLINAQLVQNFNSQEAFLANTKKGLFKDLPQPLEWVDGSGLSRYNLFTPQSMIKVLEIIYRQLSWQEISLIFPKGGVSGTIKDWYGAETPYVFAKTGTLRHNHCLSGYIITKSGKRLIFSFMNNHYTNGTTEVKQEMQKILEAIRDAY